MRLRRVASAGALSLVALLAWLVGVRPADRAPVGQRSAATRVAPPTSRVALSAQRLLTSRTARQSARVAVRHLLLTRARATDGDGDATRTSLLAISPLHTFGDVAQAARTRLWRLARNHLPSSEPSPFDATAPPTSSGRNG